MPEKDIKEGDEVSWPWFGGHPGGKAAEVKPEGEIAIKSKKGNTIKKNASPDNPAVHISRPGNDVVKRMNELDKEADGGGSSGGAEKSGGGKDAKANGEQGKKAGDKHGRSEANGAADGASDAKKSRKTPDKKAPAAASSKKTDASSKKTKGPSRAAASSDGPGSRTRSKQK